MVNGEGKECEPSPYIENGRTMVPLRVISETMEAEVEWNADTYEATITKGDKIVVVKKGSRDMIVDGKKKSMDVPATIKEERLMIPLRSMGDILGVSIEWDVDTRTVIIGDKGKQGEDKKEEQEKRTKHYREIEEETEGFDGNYKKWSENREDNIEAILNLDIRATSNLDGDAVKAVLMQFYNDKEETGKIAKDSNKYPGLENKYRVNTVFIIALGIHEAGRDIDSKHREKHNLYSINMTDSNPNGGFKYKSYIQGTEEAYKLIDKSYLSPKGAYYQGGTTLKHLDDSPYASDPMWGRKIATLMYDIYRFLDSEGYEYDREAGTAEELESKFDILENLAKKTGVRGLRNDYDNITNFFLYKMTIKIIAFFHYLFYIVCWILIAILLLLWGIWLLARTGFSFAYKFMEGITQGRIDLTSDNSWWEMLKISLYVLIIVTIIITGFLELMVSKGIIYLFSLF